MPTVYLDSSIGNNANSYVQAQDPSTPWETPQYANDNATALDTVSMASGTYDSGASNINLNEQLTWIAPDGGVTWTSSNASYTVRISATAADGDVINLTGFTIDAADTGAACFDHGNNTGEDHTVTYTDMIFANATTSAFTHNQRRGTSTFINCTFTGNTPTGFTTSSGFGDAAVSTITFTNPVFNLTPVGASVRGIVAKKSSTQPTWVGSTFTITNPTGAITAPAGFTAKGIELGGLRGAVVEDITPLFVVSGDNSGSHRVVEFTGAAANSAINFVGAILRNCEIEAAFNAGHVVEMGSSGSDNQGSTGTISNVKVTGLRPDLITGTPHNITAGQNTTITATDIESVWGHIGFLSSLNGNLDLDGAVFRDNEGTAIYVKGCSGGEAKNCVVYNSGTYPTSAFGLVSVNDQGGTDNTVFTFDAVQVYVADQLTVNALATIAPSSAATYSADIYYLPNDTGVNVVADDYFGRQADSAVDTLSEWQLDHATDDIDAVTYSQYQILSIINGTLGSSRSMKDIRRNAQPSLTPNFKTRGASLSGKSSGGGKHRSPFIKVR